jgi:outer membrane protein TolC
MQFPAGILLALLFLPLPGYFCFGADQNVPPPIRKNIAKKINEQAGNAEGGHYWDLLKKNEYQGSADLEKSRDRLPFERRREEAAADLIKKGPLILAELLAFSLEFNDRVLAARAGLRAVQGENLVNLSRFLPHVSYLFRRQTVDSAFARKNNAENQSIRVSQKLLELGYEPDSSLLFRESQRSALFGYEETVGRVLQGIRSKFFTILLWQEQISERQALLSEYKSRYENMRELEKVRRVLEVDVLTSRLNMLHEEARINALEKELYRQKMELAEAVGFPVSLTDYSLKGDFIPMTLDMESCVVTALRRSTALAQARAQADEQRRLNNRTWWEWGPGLSLALKWRKDKNGAGLSVERDQGTYNVVGFGEQYFKGPDTAILTGNEILASGGQGWYFDVSAELPLFQGLRAWGKHKQAKALLEQSTFSVRMVVDSVELSVRRAYQYMLEQQKELAILKETAEISRERLTIQEKLKELGKITDNELETFRNRFFDDQTAYYNSEVALIETQEELRFQMRWFEPDAAGEKR